MSNQQNESSPGGSRIERRITVPSRISRFWAWTRRRVFRSRPQIISVNLFTRIPSTLSDDSWDDADSDQTNSTRNVSSPVPDGRPAVVPRKRFENRKLEQDHFAKVTNALIDEMKKNNQNRKLLVTEPNLSHTENTTGDVIKKDSVN